MTCVVWAEQFLCSVKAVETVIKMAGDCPILDVGKVKTNLWTLSCNTKQVDDLCLRMADLFTTEERSLMVILLYFVRKCH